MITQKNVKEKSFEHTLDLSSSPSVFQAGSLGFTSLGVIFVYVTVFFSPTIEVVTFRFRGWCMLGVFYAACINPSRK